MSKQRTVVNNRNIQQERARKDNNIELPKSTKDRTPRRSLPGRNWPCPGKGESGPAGYQPRHLSQARDQGMDHHRWQLQFRMRHEKQQLRVDLVLHVVVTNVSHVSSLHGHLSLPRPSGLQRPIALLHVLRDSVSHSPVANHGLRAERRANKIITGPEGRIVEIHRNKGIPPLTSCSPGSPDTTPYRGPRQGSASHPPGVKRPKEGWTHANLEGQRAWQMLSPSGQQSQALGGKARHRIIRRSGHRAVAASWNRRLIRRGDPRPLLKISNVWYSVIVNGVKEGFFTSSRGLRQGDPLSPSLFIIAAEVLSVYLARVYENVTVPHFTQPPGTPHIHHLAYADDVIIFSTYKQLTI
nr:putative ribonuclease H protein [Ipomoea batatas]